MKEPVDHIQRPLLPWRGQDSAMTECGYGASEVKTITREQFVDRLKDYGQQRTAIMTCMTCSDTARRWGSWDEDPRQALAREIQWERGDYLRARSDRGERLKDDLLAIADLVEMHRAEFDAIVTVREQRREWLAKKASVQKRPKPREIGGL